MMHIVMVEILLLILINLKVVFFFLFIMIAVQVVKKTHIYSVEELRKMNNKKYSKSSSVDQHIEIVPSFFLSCSSPTRSSTPDCKRIPQEQSSPMETPKFVSSPQPFDSKSLENKERSAYSKLIQSISRKNHELNLDLIPKDPQLGKVTLVNYGYGKIQTIDPVFNLNDFYFDKKDCLLDEDESPLVEGDRVMFTIMINENKIFAVNIRRVAKRTISSPDFSRLVMRQSNSTALFEDFEL